MSALDTLNLSTAIEVVYQVGRVLAYRDGAGHMLANLRRKSATDPASAAAVGILDGIEREAGQPIGSLSETQAAARLHPLSKEIERRTAAEWGGDPLVGRRILAEMRAGRPLSV
jgi:hypothetical protein